VYQVSLILNAAASEEAASPFPANDELASNDDVKNNMNHRNNNAIATRKRQS
jgi:hypothetical protein